MLHRHYFFFLFHFPYRFLSFLSAILFMPLFKKKPSRVSLLPNFRTKFMHFSSPREINGKQAMIGNARAKFWYFFVAMFLVWFLLLYFCHSSSKVNKNRIRSNFNILGNVRELVSILLHGNSSERAMQEREHNVESSTGVDPSGDPVDSIIDSDLEKFIQQISDAEDGSMPENGKNKFPDKRNAAKDNGVVRKKSKPRKKSKSRSGKRKRITANKDRSIEKIPGEGIAAGGNVLEEPIDLLPADIRKKPYTDRKLNPGNEEHVVDQVITEEVPAGIAPKVVSDPKLCSGRYIYIHDIPSVYNEGLVQHCRSLSIWNNMCPFTSNFGLGPVLENSEKVFSSTGWFETNQFMLEIVFHNRMKQYECLTNDSSLASAIFVPYYAGLDVTRMLWNSNWYVRDYNSLNLVKWLRERPEWKRMWGGDHFMVAGRIAWDFRRERNRKSDWGNKLMILPEARNMTILAIESSPWNQNDYAIPYPTYFHPSSYDEVFQWQNRMRRQRRPYLFSFAGAPRPNMNYSIRGEIINQCQAAGRKCQLLECVHGHGGKCYEPSYLMRMFQTSTFCLQPSGDSYTRRSTFDSILGGCIPVFFHPGSAYVQYLWHLPRDYTTYSVFIPEKRIKEGKVSIDEVLSRFPIKKVVAMREAVIKLIPQVVYADPRFVLTLEDAFDKTVDGVLERVRSIKKEMDDGKNPFDVVEEFTWKTNFFGIGTDEKHEWDPLFDRTKMFG